MKYGQFIAGLFVGYGLYYLWAKSNAKKAETITETIAQVKEDEVKKYSAPIQKKYNIVMPSDMVAKKVRQKAKQLTEGRYEMDLNKVKEPVSI